MATNTANVVLSPSQFNPGKLEKTFSLSLKPDQLRLLRQRAFELSIPCTVLLRILLEVEQRDGLVRRELIARLNKGRQTLRSLSKPRRHR